MKALRYILYGLVIAAACGILAYQGLVSKTLDSSDITKCVLIIAGALISMLRPARRRKPSNRKVTYQKAYGEFIQNAFSDDPKLEKKLYDAIDDYNANKPAAAISKLEKLRKECQRTSDLYAVTAFLGLCCDDMKQYEEAAAYYEAASRMRPNSTMLSNRGLCLQRLGNYEEAEKAYHAAVQLDPKNEYPLNNLSALCFSLGEYEEALGYAKDALAINAKMPQALSTAAVCCALLEYEEDYSEYYRRAVAAGYSGNKIKETIKMLDPSL